MEIEFRSIKTLNLNIKRHKVTNQFSSYYTVLKNIHNFSLLKAINHYSFNASLPVVITNNFLPGHLLYSFPMQEQFLNCFRHLFINITCIRKSLHIKSLKTEFHTFKIVIDNWITYANSSIKTLFPYNCKNFIVHFLDKTDLLFRSDNKTRFTAWKMLQTTTI